MTLGEITREEQKKPWRIFARWKGEKEKGPEALNAGGI